MGMLSINPRQIGDVVVLDLKGEIDLYNTPELKQAIDEHISKGKRKIIINMSDVSYIDSSGIGALVSAASNLKKYGGELKLVGLYGSVRKVFELTKLTSFFSIYRDVAEALDSFTT